MLKNSAKKDQILKKTIPAWSCWDLNTIFIPVSKFDQGDHFPSMLILVLANKGQKKKASSSSSETSYTIFVILSPSDQAILFFLLHIIHKRAKSNLKLHFKPDVGISFFQETNHNVVFWLNTKSRWYDIPDKILYDDHARTYEQPHYDNRDFGNVYLSASC